MRDIADSTIEGCAQGLAVYVINAVVVEGRSVSEVAAAHDTSRSWLDELLAATGPGR